MPRNYKTNLFQKRQYEWLAETIRTLIVPNQDIKGNRLDVDIDVHELVAQHFARALSGSNPAFDKQRFLDACQPTED